MTYSTCSIYNTDLLPTCQHPEAPCDPRCKHYETRTLYSEDETMRYRLAAAVGAEAQCPKPALRARAVHRKLFLFVAATLAAIVALGYVLGEWLV